MDLKITFYHNSEKELLATIKGADLNITLSAPSHDKNDPIDLKRELLGIPTFIQKIYEMGCKNEPLQIAEEEIIID